ncbi:flavin reductase [Brevibacterium sp. 5221]|uniref:Flavin reductase n=1 Tax=Brevibacterium rongguiense TaxID=2695267 RepID=A0A6N9HA40_9MICO|nr:flavin reductase family protein [Brevibacterium rongguiense]MYM20626.1 flavin reductase [Brevibacterium rongguiense]
MSTPEPPASPPPAQPPARPGFADAYRSAAAALPSGTCALLAGRPAGAGGRLTAITVGSALDVSYDPPTMAVAVYSGSRMMEALDSARAFTLSVLAADQKGIAQWLGTPGQPSYGLLDGIELVPGEAGPPHLAGCAAHFEIAIDQRIEIATHTLLAGRVLACGAQPGRRPLVRWGDGYGTVG